MKNKLFRKGLVVGIIVLFIGVGIQPAVSNEFSQETDIETDCGCGNDNNLHNNNPILCDLLNKSLSILFEKIIYYVEKAYYATTEIEVLLYLALLGVYYTYSSFIYHIYSDVLKCEKLDINFTEELSIFNTIH